MKIIVILLILATTMYGLVVSRVDNISHYQCNTFGIKRIVFLCNENYKGDAFNYKNSSCSLDLFYTISDLYNVAINCSMPNLNTHLSTYYKNYTPLSMLDLSTIGLTSVNKENLDGLSALIDLNLSHNKLTEFVQEK